MAAALLADALPDCNVASAGLGALIGMPADPIAISLMHSQHLDISGHRATQINSQLATNANLIFTMNADQQRRVLEQYPQVRGRVFRIGHYCGLDVPDPYQQGREVFEKSLGIIGICTAGWIERIKKISKGTHQK